MSNEENIEGLRRELGEKTARDNEGSVHESASDSFRAGYRRGYLGFGSNVTPRHFGWGTVRRPDPWTCICETENRRYYAKCQMCGVSYELAQQAKDSAPGFLSDLAS